MHTHEVVNRAFQLDSSGKMVYKETETHMKKSSNNKEMTFNEVHLNGYSVAISPS